VIAKIAKIGGVAFAFVVVAGISAYLTLTLIIKTEDTVIVPDLEGKDVVYALELLTELELNTKVKGSEYTTDIPKNHVVFQEPQPGSGLGNQERPRCKNYHIQRPQNRIDAQLDCTFDAASQYHFGRKRHVPG
jgi:hypothetical protein